MAHDLKDEDLIVTFVLCVVQVAGNFVFLHSAWKQHVPCHLHATTNSVRKISSSNDNLKLKCKDSTQMKTNEIR